MTISLRGAFLAAAFGALAVLPGGPLAAQQMLRVNIPMDPPHMNPILYQENVSFRVLSDIYEGFTSSTPEGGNMPALALSWTPLDGGRHGFSFKLRPGVTFHTGRPFGAKDVKATFEMMLDPKWKAGNNVQFLQNVVGAAEVKAGTRTDLPGVRVIDDLTVEVEFTRPSVIFPSIPIQFLDAAFVAEHGPDWISKGSAGTGPFKATGWTRGVRVETEAHAGYWGGAPKLKGIRFLVIPNADTVFNQYDAGELDVADLQESMFDRVMRDPRYKAEMVEGTRAALWWMGLNQNLYAPFKDKRVREAVSLAINRNGIVSGMFRGAAFTMDGFVPPGIGGYKPNLPKLEYNPTRAKQLLAEAGYPDGKGLPPLTITGWPDIKDLLTYYAAQMKSVLGMPVTPDIVERVTWIKSVNAGEVAFFPSRWTGSYNDPSVFLDEIWHSKSPVNRARWSNAEYDALIEQARATSDHAARLALFERAEKILVADWGGFSLPVPVTAGLKKPNVKNVTTHPVGFLNVRAAEIN
jgi:oligopeptide transport system substrate-binding protein